MSGTIGSNIVRHSGTIAETAAGLSWTTAVVTGSTVTVEAGNGYFINTTSNACTITLPSSAEAGDQIVLVDYDRTWGTNAITIDSKGLNYQGDDDTYTVEYTTDGQSLNIVYSDSTKGWLPLEDDVAADEPVTPVTQKAIFAFGYTNEYVSTSNLVNSSGVVGSDVTGVGTVRNTPGAATYDYDKAIFAYGYTTGDSVVSMSNLVSNSGVVASDVTGVGTARNKLGATSYGINKAMFAYGSTGSPVSLKNLVSTSGVIADDVTGVGTAREGVMAAGYGSTGLAFFAFGNTHAAAVSVKNLVTAVGVIGSDVTGVGTARWEGGATSYGEDKAVIAYGYVGGYVSMSNLVSNVGVVASDVSGVGTARGVAAAGYGGDKGIFGFGSTGSATGVTNLVNNSGVIGSDVSAVGAARNGPGAAGYSISA